MEKKITEKATGVSGKPITRKEAIKKTGLIAATAATTMILLGTPASAKGSPHCGNDDDQGENNNKQGNNNQGNGWYSGGKND